MKRPSFQFYPADWRKDAALQSCSIAAQGLWINAMCIAHECEPYGHLVVNGKPMDAAKLGRLVGLSEKDCTKLIDELGDAGVVERTAEGVIYSRRMVRDEELRNKRANGGSAGAEHGIKGAAHGSKGGRPKAATGVNKPPLEPPPSSSSSSSTYSEGKPSDGQPSAKDAVFANGVPLLTVAGVAEKNARSMLAMLCKTHGDDAVADAIAECAKHRPVEPVSWLQAVLKPVKQVKPESFRERDERAARERVAAFAPGVAARSPTTPTPITIESESRHVAAIEGH